MPAHRPLAERLDEKLDKTSPCWTWTAAVSTSGYGVIGVSADRTDYAHRVSYALAKGEIPAGMQIDHLCRNKLCCNPAHLDVVPQQINRQRQAASMRKERTTCKHGHETSLHRRTMPSGRTYCAACRKQSPALLTGDRP